LKADGPVRCANGSCQLVETVRGRTLSANEVLLNSRPIMAKLAAQHPGNVLRLSIHGAPNTGKYFALELVCGPQASRAINWGSVAPVTLRRDCEVDVIEHG